MAAMMTVSSTVFKYVIGFQLVMLEKQKQPLSGV